MILAGVLLLALHVDRRDTEKLCLGARQGDFGASVFGSVHLNGGAPAFVVADALADVLAEVFVIRVSGPIVRVEMGF